jgi:hypothetical protein
MVEGITLIAESISRCAVIEELYPLSGSAAAARLETVLVQLYTEILKYLSKSKAYFNQNTAS